MVLVDKRLFTPRKNTAAISWVWQGSVGDRRPYGNLVGDPEVEPCLPSGGLN